MKSSQYKFNQMSHSSAQEIYELERIMWRQQGKGVIVPNEILDNQLKQEVIRHLNEKYGQ